MFWRGDRRQIYVLAGEPQSGVLVRNFPVEYFPDTWEEGQDSGGGPAPQPGLFLPKRGFGKVWRENNLQATLGYALTADEVGYEIAVQVFARGLLLSSETPAGRSTYVIYISHNLNGAVASGRYERYAAGPR